MKHVLRILLVMAIVAFLLPVAVMIGASLLPPEAVQSLTSGKIPDNAALTLRQYRDVLTNPGYVAAFLNSVRIALPAVALHMPISIIAALLFCRVRKKTVKLMQVLYITALLMPFQVIMMPVYKLSVDIGLYDSVWASILIGAASPLGALAIAVIMARIPQEQWESISLETDSVCKTLAGLVLPQLRVGLLLVALISFSEAWNMVEQPLILLADPEKKPLSLMLNDIVGVDTTSLFAGAVIYALPVLIVYAFAAFILVRRKKPE
jgi:multiple sugar transport system permease protein